MKSLRHGILLALVLVGTAVAVAAPAFATPNLTASSGTGPVAPFITPMGNTRNSSSDAISTNFRYTIGTIAFQCRTASLAGYVTTTHTQMRITSARFGDGRGGTCTSNIGLGIDGDSIAGSSSARPWHLHFSQIGAGNSSGTGTLNLSTATSFTLTLGGIQCEVTWPAGQSLAMSYAFDGPVLALHTRIRTNVSGAFCPRSGDNFFEADYWWRPSTARHRLSITALS
jgi:hypothetical protein